MAMLPSKCTSPEPCETIPMDIEANGADVIWLEDPPAGREMGNSRCACIEGWTMVADESLLWVVPPRFKEG